MSQKARIGGESWTVTRQPAVGVGARAEGDNFPDVPPSGLRFHGPRGQTRFLPLDDLPTEDELINIDTFIEHFSHAAPERPPRDPKP